MNNNSTKIVTLIPSATEIVAFLGQKNSIIGRSHECDYPKGLNHIVKLTSPKIDVDGTSKEIDKQINTILENSLSVYKVDVPKLKQLNPDFIITQAHCEVCAVSFSTSTLYTDSEFSSILLICLLISKLVPSIFILGEVSLAT